MELDEPSKAEVSTTLSPLSPLNRLLYKPPVLRSNPSRVAKKQFMNAVTRSELSWTRRPELDSIVGSGKSQIIPLEAKKHVYSREMMGRSLKTTNRERAEANRTWSKDRKLSGQMADLETHDIGFNITTHSPHLQQCQSTTERLKPVTSTPSSYPILSTAQEQSLFASSPQKPSPIHGKRSNQVSKLSNHAILNIFNPIDDPNRSNGMWYLPPRTNFLQKNDQTNTQIASGADIGGILIHYMTQDLNYNHSDSLKETATIPATKAIHRGGGRDTKPAHFGFANRTNVDIRKKQSIAQEK